MNRKISYLKISDRSGCTAENFKIKFKESESLIVPIDERELSGSYKPLDIKQLHCAGWIDYKQSKIALESENYLTYTYHDTIS